MSIIDTDKDYRSKKFLELFEKENSLIQEEASQYLKSYRLIELFIAPGRAIAKIQDEVSKSIRIEILFKQAEENVWGKVINTIASNAYYYGCYLSGELPVEISDIVFSQNRSDIQFNVDGNNTDEFSKQINAVIYKLSEKINSDPFTILILRGKGNEELLIDIKKQRSKLAIELSKNVNTSSKVIEEDKQNQEVLEKANDNFWTLDSKIYDLTYEIKADELPAAILKWLDPLPLYGLEEEIDYRLENAYVHIANRAHAYGLGL